MFFDTMSDFNVPGSRYKKTTRLNFGNRPWAARRGAEAQPVGGEGVYMYVCRLCIYIYIYVYVHTYTHIHIYVYTPLCVCVHAGWP